MKLAEIIKKHHKLFTLFITAMICAVLLTVGTTFAWLTDSDYKTNDMHLADLEGVVGIAASVNMAPGTPMSQNVSVTNTGDSPVFVRALILPVCVIDGVSREIEIGNQLKVTFNSSWIYCQEDGYYYYISKIEPGETSDNIFTSVELLTAAGTMFQGAEWAFEFKAEFVGITKYAYRTAWWQDKTLETPDDDVLIEIDNALAPLVQR